MVFVLKKLATLLGKGHLCASENETNKAEVPLLQYNCASEPAPQNLQKETGSGLRRECPESSEVWNLNLALMLQKSSWKRLGGELF